MGLTDAQVATLGEVGVALFQSIQPYLPALARATPAVFEGFIAHLRDKDWAAVDRLLYEQMTPAERHRLEDQVYKDAMQAARDKYDRIKLEKDALMSFAIKAVMLALTMAAGL